MSNPYCIFTDSSSDLPADYLKKEGISSFPLSFEINGEQYRSGDLEESEFYRRMRAGAMPSTSQVNVDDALRLMTPMLEKEIDILYIGFSSLMSGTLNSVRLAADELRERYPGRVIEIVDSLSVSLGEGLLVYLANHVKKAGASLEQTARWASDHAKDLAHFITTSNLTHLHHGGRISKTATILGSLLGVQPIISMENGKPKLFGSQRGGKASLQYLVDQMGKVVGKAMDGICCIAHTDCEQDAQYVQELVRKRFNIRQFLINQAGPVLGTHTGPGAVALFMMNDPS